MSESTKSWYKSKLIGVGLVTILLSVADAITRGLDWRQAVVLVIGGLVVVFRKYTSTALGSQKQ